MFPFRESQTSSWSNGKLAGTPTLDQFRNSGAHKLELSGNRIKGPEARVSDSKAEVNAVAARPPDGEEAGFLVFISIGQRCNHEGL
jgi:hypothetical protein